MSMSDMETKIYNLVAKRFLENLLPEYKYEETTYSFNIENKVFSAKGLKVIQEGYKELSREELKNKTVNLQNGSYKLESLVYNKKTNNST